MKLCRKCKVSYEDPERNFCAKCGSTLVEVSICPNCHTENELDFAFCKKCGAKLSVNSTENSVSTQTSTSPQVNTTVEQNNKNNNSKSVIVAAIVVAIAGLALYFFSGSHNQNNVASKVAEPQKNTSQIQNEKVPKAPFPSVNRTDLKVVDNKIIGYPELTRDLIESGLNERWEFVDGSVSSHKVLFFDKETVVAKEPNTFEVWLCDYYTGHGKRFCIFPACQENNIDKIAHYHYEKWKYDTKALKKTILSSRIENQKKQIIWSLNFSHNTVDVQLFNVFYDDQKNEYKVPTDDKFIIDRVTAILKETNTAKVDQQTTIQNSSNNVGGFAIQPKRLEDYYQGSDVIFPGSLQVKITETGVNMRSDPGRTNSVIDSFDKNEIVVVIDVEMSKDAWVQVRRKNGKVGWINADYCELVKGANINYPKYIEAVTTLYRFDEAITKKDYKTAYNLLSPEAQKTASPPDQWGQGYSDVISKKVIEAYPRSTDGPIVSVEYLFEAKDKTPSGISVKYYRGFADLQKFNGEWKIVQESVGRGNVDRKTLLR